MEYGYSFLMGIFAGALLLCTVLDRVTPKMDGGPK